MPPGLNADVQIWLRDRRVFPEDGRLPSAVVDATDDGAMLHMVQTRRRPIVVCAICTPTIVNQARKRSLWEFPECAIAINFTLLSATTDPDYGPGPGLSHAKNADRWQR